MGFFKIFPSMLSHMEERLKKLLDQVARAHPGQALPSEMGSAKGKAFITQPQLSAFLNRSSRPPTPAPGGCDVM